MLLPVCSPSPAPGGNAGDRSVESVPPPRSSPSPAASFKAQPRCPLLSPPLRTAPFLLCSPTVWVGDRLGKLAKESLEHPGEGLGLDRQWGVSKGFHYHHYYYE